MVGWRLDATQRRDLAIAVALSAACLLAMLLCTTLKTEGTALYKDPGWDRHVYRLMAEENPLRFGLAPFNHRVLMPLLAESSPLGLEAGFMTVTFASAWACGVGQFMLVRASGLNRVFAAAGTLLLFSMGWGLRFSVADFWVPDAFIMAFVIWALLAAVRRQFAAFVVLVGLGCLVKESMVFVAPLYYCVNARRLFDRKLLRPAVVSVAVGVVVVVGLHLLIPDKNENANYFVTLPADFQRFPELYNHYNYGDLLHDIGKEQRYHDRDWATFLSYTFDPFGLVAPILAAIALARHWRTMARYAPLVLLVYIQLLFATDTQRLLTLAAPLVCVWAMQGGSDLRRLAGLPDFVVLIVAVGALAFLLDDPLRYATPFASQWLLVTILAVATPAAWMTDRCRAEPARRKADSAAGPVAAVQSEPPSPDS